MLQGLYAAASGMEAQQTQFTAIANDLSNLDTPGYQSTVVGFQDMLYSSGGVSSGSTMATGAGASSAIIGRNDGQGAMQSTNRPLDVAIAGEGFLQVRRPDGTIGLTRNGALQVDGQGQLTNQQGMLLQPPITLPRGVTAGELKIAPDGAVTANGRKLGQISIVDVPAPDKLLADGDSMFSATAASGAIRQAPGSSLQQGALEGSNVDVSQAMSTMIDAQRSYQMASQAVQYQDQMLQIANQIKK